MDRRISTLSVASLLAALAIASASTVALAGKPPPSVFPEGQGCRVVAEGYEVWGRFNLNGNKGRWIHVETAFGSELTVPDQPGRTERLETATQTIVWPPVETDPTPLYMALRVVDRKGNPREEGWHWTQQITTCS